MFAVAICGGLSPAVAAAGVRVERVTFASADGEHQITGYLFSPSQSAGRHPAIVMLHGRGGAYSSLAHDLFNADTLSQRHKMWGRLWAEHGFSALMVDDFGSLGYPGGFGRGSYKDRPEALDEVTRRPLHAYGALRWLRSRPDIDGTRVGLMGWSNGGSATLAAMADDKVGDMRVHGFRAGVALYPGCGLKNRFSAKGYKPYAPVRVTIGTADEEVSPSLCEKLVARSRAQGGRIELTTYAGATHSYDTPTRSRQQVRANAEAAEDTKTKVVAFFDEMLGR
jgi:carboxymethylenebutenolidase